MRRWALVLVGAATFAAAGLSFVLPAADASIVVCGSIRANSPGTFFNLDQTECQSVGLPQVNSIAGVADIPPSAVPPVALPSIPTPPVSPGQTGELGLGVSFDGQGEPLTGGLAPSVGFPVPATPLPQTIILPGIPSVPPPLPPLPVPIPALPVPIPALPV